MAVFWVVAPCSLVVRAMSPDDGGSKYLRNIGKLLPDYTALQPRRQPSSYSPPWEPQIVLRIRKMAVFWVVAPCSLVVRAMSPDDGGSKDLWNVSKLLPDYTALQPRRQPFSYSPPWEPQILLRIRNVKRSQQEEIRGVTLLIWCLLFILEASEDSEDATGNNETLIGEGMIMVCSKILFPHLLRECGV
jgi:hypothetical protein